MLKKTEYQKLTAGWKKHGTVYQLYDRYQVRFPTLLKHLDVFKGKDVLEVGSNAGLAAYHIAQVAKSYTGVEGEKGYFNQALETKKSIENKDVEFLNMSIKSFIKRSARGDIKRNVNAAFLSYVLYHFSDKEVGLFASYILPKLDAIIVMSRYENRNRKGRTAHNSYKFWKPKNVQQYLEKSGFKTTIEYGPRNKFHFIVGLKEAEKARPITTMVKPVEKEPVKTYEKEIHDALLKDSDTNKLTEEKMEELMNKAFETGGKEITEEANEDTGDSGIHKEGEGKTTPRRGTRGGEGRVAEGKSRSAVKRAAARKGPGGNVRAEDKDEGDKGVLQSGVEKGPEKELRDKDIQKVEKTVRNRRSTTTGQNRNSTRKPAVQKNETQSDSVRNTNTDS